MKKSIRLIRLSLMLLVTLTLGGCETLRNVFGGSPAELAPSTFCQIYRPIKAPYPPGSSEFHAWWDQYAVYAGTENDLATRSNNESFRRLNCQ